MSIRVTCQKCGVVLKVKEDLAGTKCKCPACKGTLHVPTLEEAAQAAGAPLGATETASVSDTGAIKVPTKTKPAKVAAAGDQSPPAEANGVAHAPTTEAAPPRKEAAPPALPPGPPAESSTGDVAEGNGEAPPKVAGKSRLKMPESDEVPAPTAEKPRAEGKQKLRMSDTDAEESAPPAEKPKADASPKAKPEAKPAAEAEPPKGAAAKSGNDEFDLDSFLMEGPKPKALPPVPEEGAAKKGPAARPGSGRRLSMSDDETNVPGPSETLPPPNRGRVSAAESAMAALTGGGGTASSAKDLLARASQEGRNRASQMPEEARERIDIAAAVKTIFQQYGLQVIGTIVLCVVLYAGMNYMMGDGVDLPPLARISGKVTLKGTPVPGVVVNFTPIGSKDSKDGDEKKLKRGAPRSATALTDKDGNYELMYMEGVRGAVIGQNRVWIDPFAPENFKKIPGQWQSAGTSGDIREVKETGGVENIELQK
jgi:phage FluMu protein Com